MKLALFLLCSCYFTLPSSSSTDHLEQQLHEKLFKNYDPSIRPSEPATPVVVSIKMEIESIVDVKDKEGVITVAGWIIMKWNDTFLCWDPAEYGNISYIVVPAEKVWRPDITFKSALENRFFDVRNVPVLINSSCMVSFAWGGVSTHSCKLDTTLFPFDTQRCTFHLETWFSRAELVILKNRTLEYFGDPNEVWDAVGTLSEVSDVEKDRLMAVQFTLTIKRKFLYYVTYIFLPLIMMAIVNLLVFWLPAASGEKLSLAITVLLAFYVLLITINEQLPVSSTSTPLLTIYTSCLMSICTLSMVVTVFVVRLHHYEGLPIPPWVIKLLRLGGKNSGNKSAIAREQERPLRGPLPAALPSWSDVAAAVDHLAFFVFLTIECLITFIIATCYAAAILNVKSDSE